MALLLNLETSTPVCSVSLSVNDEVISSKVSFEDKSHSALLTVFIDDVLKQAGYSMNKIDAVSVSEGPGSYTGLRIGVSVAKGICYALHKPLIAVDTLKAMAIMAREKYNLKEGILCPMIDARRMEVYTKLFDIGLETIEETSAKIVDKKSFNTELNNHPVHFFGNGSAKCQQTLQHPNAHFLSDIYPLADYMAPLAFEAFQHSKFQDVAYFEPYYLKDFVALVSQKKLF